jgi:NAD(P)-dependent dehydrogenase (short-subunit alcohol dehydrogenase family)
MGESFLVSGGSGGIGSALCRALAAAGYRPVVGFGKSSDAASNVAGDIGGVALPLDLTSDRSIGDAVDTLAADQIPLAGLVLAASPPPAIGPFGKIATADMVLQWRVNVEGPRQLLAGVVRRCLRPRHAGIVVAVLSEAMGDEGNVAGRGMGAYLIAKYGLLGLMRVLAAEYPWLRTATVRPGYTETAMLAAFDPRFLDGVRASMPGGRFAEPDAVAREVVATIAELKSA